VIKAARAADRPEAPVAVALNHPTLGKTAADIGRRTPEVGLVELWNSDEPAATALWWEMLNAGRRVFAETGSDSHHRENAPLGYRRTYVFLGDAPLTRANIVQALRAGRSFLSRGALLDFRVNGERPGGAAVAGSGPLTLTINVESAVPLDHIVIIRNGQTVHRIALEGRTACTEKVSLPARAGDDGWYLAQVFARNDRLPVALCNPVFVGRTPTP
jgi:hypothetical protein